MNSSNYLPDRHSTLIIHTHRGTPSHTQVMIYSHITYTPRTATAITNCHESQSQSRTSHAVAEAGIGSAALLEAVINLAALRRLSANAMPGQTGQHHNLR